MHPFHRLRAVDFSGLTWWVAGAQAVKYASSWRTTNDITDNWAAVLDRSRTNNQFAALNIPGTHALPNAFLRKHRCVCLTLVGTAVGGQATTTTPTCWRSTTA